MNVVIWLVLLAAHGTMAAFSQVPERAPHVYKYDKRILTTSDMSKVSAKKMQPGEAIMLKCKEHKNVHVHVYGEGLPHQPAVIMPLEPGCVTFTRGSRLTVHGNYIEVQGFKWKGSYSGTKGSAVVFDKDTKGNRLVGCTFDGYWPSDTKVCLVELWGRDHEVDWNTFVNMDHEGELVRVKSRTREDPDSTPPSMGHRIAYNYFGPRKRMPDGQTGECIQLGLGNEHHDTGVVIEFNLFDKYNGEIEAISLKTSGNTVQHNTFRESASCVCVRHGFRNTVASNYFFGDRKKGTCGIRVHGHDNKVKGNYVDGENSDNGAAGSIVLHGGRNDNGKIEATRTLVEGNLVVGCHYCLTFGNGGDKPVKDTTLRDNVFFSHGDSDYLVREYEEGDSKTKWEDNVFVGGGKLPSSIKHLHATGVLDLVQNDHGVKVPNNQVSFASKGYAILWPEASQGQDTELVHHPDAFEYRPLVKEDVGARTTLWDTPTAPPKEPDPDTECKCEC